MDADNPNNTGEYVARVQYLDGRVEEVSNVNAAIFEYLFEELSDDHADRALYFPRTDGGTVLSRTGGITRIDVVKVEEKQ